jgi:hypothetical protein
MNNQLVEKIRRRLREEQNLSLVNLEEIIEYDLELFMSEIEVVNVYQVELYMNRVITLVEIFVTQLLELLNVHFGIRIDFGVFPKLRTDMSKSIIEVLVLNYKPQYNFDVVETLKLTITEILYNYDNDIEKISDIYLHKEISNYVKEHLLEIDKIYEELKISNPILITDDFINNNKAILLPIKWMMVEPVNLFKSAFDEKVTLILKCIMLGKVERIKNEDFA